MFQKPALGNNVSQPHADAHPHRQPDQHLLHRRGDVQPELHLPPPFEAEPLRRKLRQRLGQRHLVQLLRNRRWRGNDEVRIDVQHRHHLPHEQHHQQGDERCRAPAGKPAQSREPFRLAKRCLKRVFLHEKTPLSNEQNNGAR